jgi:hypothetical protein
MKASLKHRIACGFIPVAAIMPHGTHSGKAHAGRVA